MKGIWPSVAAAAGLFATGVKAQSYKTIPTIEAYGQHFFYSNNGTQFFFKGVAYQQNYQPNGTTSENTTYTDPLADGAACRRDIPYMKQIFTNVIRVYAIDPNKDHNDCMEQLAAADIYVVADLGEPSTSIRSNDPEWDVTLYRRYTSVVDNLSQYNNVIGFFAGNENVSSKNQTAAAAFVKAAVRDIKGYIKSQGYRTSLGVGYATADVDSRDDLAAYFACEPGDSGNQTQIDFWGYNVYSWCGESTYQRSSYDERVQFFSDYPVPVFFAEYGCIDVEGGPTRRPFHEVAVLYGNMTQVFSGGIVYEWFMGENNYGLVELTDNGASVSPYPDFTSLSSELAQVTPSPTQRRDYSATNSPPACPSTDSTWAPVASPLPPSVNPQLCACMVGNLQCNIKSTDEDAYEDAFNFICSRENGKFCAGIQRNASSGTYGGLSGCDPKDQLAWVANEYYLGNGKASSNCDFKGLATVQSATTASNCGTLLQELGTGGTNTVASPTGRGTQDVGSATGSSSKSKGGATGVNPPGFVAYGWAIGMAYMALASISFTGMVLL